MDKRMMIVVPSRGRPDNALRLLDRFYETTGDDTFMTVIVDDDDPELRMYEKFLMCDYLIGPRLRLGGTLNKFAVPYANSYDIIGFVGDDVYPHETGWDLKIKEAMIPNGIVYCNDGWQGENLPTAVFMDSNIIRSMGFMVIPGMTHLFIDNYWAELGRRLGTLTYLKDVNLEHLHPFAGKAQDDQTYREANAHHVWSADEQILKEFIDSGMMDEWVRRLQ